MLDEELEYIHQILSSPLFRLYKAGAASHEDTSMITEATREVISGMEASEDNQLSPGERKKRQLQRKQSLKALRNAVTPSNSPMVQSKGSSGRKVSLMQTPPYDAQQGVVKGCGAESSSGSTNNAVTLSNDTFGGSNTVEHASTLTSDGSLSKAVNYPASPSDTDMGSGQPLQPMIHADPPQRLPPQAPPSSYPQTPPSSFHSSLTPSKKVRSIAEVPSVVSSHTPPSPHYVATPVTEAMATRNTPTAETRRLVFTVYLEKGQEGLGFCVKGVRSEQKDDVYGTFIQDLQQGGIAER